MAEGASKYLFLRLMLVLTFCCLEVFPRRETEQKDLKREENKVLDNFPHRELLDHFYYKTTLLETAYPPTTSFPTTPVPFPPENSPTPTISTIPVTVTPNPASTPVTIPSTTPVPITNPVTTPSTVPGTQPITNPVTTYPAPTAGVPVTTPVTNPVAPPVTAGTPVVSGQSWCVVKSGALESALQAALDYACGIGGADCTAIQQGAGCYNPNTLENHASFAFNNYYQKNPVQTSCDFGGTAMVTNINPSTGACIYPTSLSSSSSPMTATTPSPTTASSSGATVAGSVSPPPVLNTSNPDLGNPSYNSSTSTATCLQPFLGCVVLVTSMVTGSFILDM